VRYFVIAGMDGPTALVTHDYQRGSYICRSKSEAFYSVFEACVDAQEIKYVREALSLRIIDHTAYEDEWVDDLLKSILECNPEWTVDAQGESSGSDLTIDDLVAEHLVE